MVVGWLLHCIVLLSIVLHLQRFHNIIQVKSYCFYIDTNTTLLFTIYSLSLKQCCGNVVTPTLLFYFHYLVYYENSCHMCLYHKNISNWSCLGMAILTRSDSTRTDPPCPARVLPAPQRWRGGYGLKKFALTLGSRRERILSDPPRPAYIYKNAIRVTHTHTHIYIYIYIYIVIYIYIYITI